MGPYPGGQAEYVRVVCGPSSVVSALILAFVRHIQPFADFNALKLPDEGHEDDFILLADIFPTGWHGVELSGFQPGETIAVFGAGPGVCKWHRVF